jgi:NAD(P)H dehydrogenase (quinone)
VSKPPIRFDHGPEQAGWQPRPAALTDKLFELLPETAHIAVDPGFFADNYLNLVPMAAQLGVLPLPTGGGRNAPPSTKTSHEPAWIGSIDASSILSPPIPGMRASRLCRETSTPHRPTQPTIASAQSRPLRYRYRRIARGTNDCRPSRVCCDSSATRRIP